MRSPRICAPTMVATPQNQAGWILPFRRQSASIPIIGKIKVAKIVIRQAFGIISGNGSKRPKPGPVRTVIPQKNQAPVPAGIALATQTRKDQATETQ